MPLIRSLRSAAGVLLAALAMTTTALAAEAPATKPLRRTEIVDFIDRLPQLLDLALPDLGPSGVFKFYTRPHFGDLLNRDYLRVPVGVRAKVTPQLGFNAEFQSYFTHGLKGSSGYGLAGALVGLKYEQELPFDYEAGWSAGINFSTPLSRPPLELTDGYRHTLPYLGLTHPISHKWAVKGYASLGADLLARTSLPSMFGRNQLHSNSLSLSVGAARDWTRFRGSLTATYSTTSLISDEDGHVFALRPAIVFPIMHASHSNTRVMLTLSGRLIWGPDGFESGAGSSLRVQFDFGKDGKTDVRSGKPAFQVRK